MIKSKVVIIIAAIMIVVFGVRITVIKLIEWGKPSDIETPLQSLDDIIFVNDGKSTEQKLGILDDYIQRTRSSSLESEKSGQSATLNAQVFERKARDADRYLQQVAAQERDAGKIDVADRVDAIAASHMASHKDLAEIIRALERQNKWSVIANGTDPVLLERLKQNLYLNRDQIMQIIELMKTINSSYEKYSFEHQLTLLMGERERIKSLIEVHESKRGIKNRFWSSDKGKSKFIVNEEQERQLRNEVEMAFRLEIDESIDPLKELNEKKAAEEAARSAAQPAENTLPAESLEPVPASTAPQDQAVEPNPPFETDQPIFTEPGSE